MVLDISSLPLISKVLAYQSLAAFLKYKGALQFPNPHAYFTP